MKSMKFLKNKKGSLMFEYFVLVMVALLIGSGVILLGGSIKEGITKGRGKVDTINQTL